MKNDFQHRAPVTAVASAGRRLVTAGYDGTVAAHDDSGSSLLGQHEHLVNAIAVSPDGLVLSGSSDYTVGAFSLTGERRPAFLHHHSDDVECVLALDGAVAVSGGRDRQIVVFDARKGEVIFRLIGHTGGINGLTRRGSTLYSIGDDGTLRAWDLTTGRFIGVLAELPHETDSVAVDPRTDRIATACDDGFVRIIDLSCPDAIRTGAHHRGGVKAVTFDRNGFVASMGYDQFLRRTDPVSGKEVAARQTPRGLWERTLTTLADGTLAAGSFEGGVWLERRGGFVAGVPGVTGNPCVNDLSVGASGAVVSCDDGVVRTIDENGVIAETAPGPALLNGVTVTPDAVLAGSHDQMLHCWSGTAPSGAADWKVRVGDGPVNSVRARGERAFVASYGGGVTVVDLASHEVVGRWQAHTGPVKAVDLHPTAELLATCSADGGVALWSTSGRLVRRFADRTAIVNDLTFSPSGDRVAAVGRDFCVTVFDVADGSIRHKIERPPRSIKTVTFLDEQTVAVGDYWGSVSVIDLVQGTTTDHELATNGIAAIAGTGGVLWAGSFDGSVTRFDRSSCAHVTSLFGAQDR